MTIDMTREIENYLYFLDFMISHISKELVDNPNQITKKVLLTLAECEKRRVLRIAYERKDTTTEEYNACVEKVYQEVEKAFPQRETPSP